MKGKAQILAIVLFALLLRWCVTYQPYSGQGKPPMFGDYEAQRHWQEITFNLPVEKWYCDSTDNDLEYWGLDYPPLTAYHSLVVAGLADKINSSYVKLHRSRGLESPDHKTFMRLTVLMADSLIYIPAMIYFFTNARLPSSVPNEQNIFSATNRQVALLTALIYPGLILIDHGHFQYNCVSLGLFVGAVAAILKDSLVAGSFLFVLALNYKQMELYHSLPFFCYILGTKTRVRTWPWPWPTASSLLALLRISLTVIVTFAVVWAPFLSSRETLSAAILRLFPIARGVFEDKVANVWCAINVVVKLREAFTNQQLARVCLLTTLLAVTPASVDLYLHPTTDKFRISLVNSALAFFLFSFQVHEKSILLVAVPVLLRFHDDPFPCFWFLLISHFSMLPLFLKDNLYSAYLATFVFYFATVRWMWSDLLKLNGSRALGPDGSRAPRGNGQTIVGSYNDGSLIAKLFYGSLTGVLTLSLASNFSTPPAMYPDLYPLLVSLYSCGHFLVFYLYFHYKQFSMSEGYSSKKLR